MSEFFANLFNITNIIILIGFIHIFLKFIVFIASFIAKIYIVIIMCIINFFVNISGFLLLDDENEYLIYARNIEYVRRNARLIIMFCKFYYYESPKNEQKGVFWDEILDIKRFNLHYIIKDIIFSNKKIKSLKLVNYIHYMFIQKTVFYKFFNKKNIFKLYYKNKKTKHNNWYWNIKN